MSEDLDVKTYLKGQHPKEKFKIGNNLYRKKRIWLSPGKGEYFLFCLAVFRKDINKDMFSFKRYDFLCEMNKRKLPQVGKVPPLAVFL